MRRTCLSTMQLGAFRRGPLHVKFDASAVLVAHRIRRLTIIDSTLLTLESLRTGRGSSATRVHIHCLGHSHRRKNACHQRQQERSPPLHPRPLDGAGGSRCMEGSSPRGTMFRQPFPSHVAAVSPVTRLRGRG